MARVSLLLAAEPKLDQKVYLLPTTYNYAYRRDRERLHPWIPDRDAAIAACAR